MAATQTTTATLRPTSWKRTVGYTPTDLISTATAKAWLRVDHSDEDSIIAAIIGGAIESAERFLNRSLLAQTWQVTATDLPYHPGGVELVSPPIVAISTVEYRDTDGTFTSYSTDDVAVSEILGASVVYRKNTASYPTSGDYTDRWRITYTTGAAAASVEVGIIEAIKLLVMVNYERGDPEWAEAMMRAAKIQLEPFRLVNR